jgi:hypothetical protein
MKRNCGCEIHGAGCCAAVVQSLGFDATRIIIQQRLLRYSTASDNVKKSQSNLEEALRRLIPRFPPDQNGLASGSGPSFGGPWFAVILGGFCRFAPNSLSTFLLTVSTSGAARRRATFSRPSFFVATTSGDAHVGEKIFGRTVESC